MIFRNWMETDMTLKLNPKYPIVDPGAMIGYDFYHLEHQVCLEKPAGKARGAQPARGKCRDLVSAFILACNRPDPVC